MVYVSGSIPVYEVYFSLLGDLFLRNSIIPPFQTDSVWGSAQSSTVQIASWTGLDHRLLVFDRMGLVRTSPHTLTILTLFHTKASLNK